MTIKARNLDESDGMQVQEWPTVASRLEGGFDQAAGAGGPNRHTTWLTTIDQDGSPHVTAVGAVWFDGAFWFQTGDVTRKAKNLARDARCAMSLSVAEFDLTVEGIAAKVTDREEIARAVATWNEGGWPCEVDPSGVGITAPFNAPALGPAPWFVYRITPTTATCVSTVEPGGLTRFTF